MGKGLDTCLVVQKMAVKSADPIEVDIAERKMKLMMLTPVDLEPQPRGGLSRQEIVEDIEKQLDKIQELPDSESYPLFHLLPEVVQHYAKLLTLPNELKGFVVSRRSPEDCLRLSKEVAIATYEGARALLGDAEAVVCVPPAELLQEPEFMARALWEGMAIMRPWDEIPAEVLAMEPQIVPNEATKDGTLNDEQKEILQEVQALVDIAEFMHYWSRRGCTLELETEYHD